MTLTELKYILAVAQERHFGRAAKRCHVSQPTLSVAIKKLESHLDTAIFERRQHDISITPVGEKIIAQAQRIIEEADVIHDIVNASQSQLDSPLRIGAIYTVAPYIFPTLIPTLKKTAPDMPLFIQEDFTANLRIKLQRGELDAIFIALPFTEPSVVTKPLYDENFVVLMPKTHKLAKKAAIDGNDLKKENTLLLGEGHCFRNQILEACPQCQRPGDLQQTVEGTSLETIRHMVASGLGITILPCTATSIKNYSNTLCTKPFKGKMPRRTVALAWRASFPRTKAIEALIQALQASKFEDACFIDR